MAENKLYRSETDKVIAGICGGIAEVYDLDPSIVRIAAVLLAFTQIGIPAYIIGWIVIPHESEI